MTKDIEIEKPGKNPLEEIFKQKLSALEGIQTQRTAREFYETIGQIFASQGINPHRSFFFEKRYFLTFQENQSEVFALSINRKGDRVVHYEREATTEIPSDKSINVGTIPAYLIPGLEKEILDRKLSPLEQMPFAVEIDEVVHELNYHPEIY